MSGIYIPGMEIPKDKGIALVLRPDASVGLYTVHSGMLYSELGERQAIPVPNHGRLIDADRLDKAIGEEVHECEWDNASFSGYRVWDLLDDAPTIIPADGGAE